MKIKRTEIVKAMKKLSMNGTGNSIVPIYDQALLICKDNVLSLSRVNNESEIHIELPVEDGKNEAMTVTVKLFCNVVEKLKTEYINIEKLDASVKVFTDNFTAVYESFGQEDFPQSNLSSENANAVQVKTEQFLNMMKMTSASCSVDNFNMALKSILLSVKAKNITSVGTDGKRMSIVQIPGEFTELTDVVLPNLYNVVKTIFADQENLQIKIYEKTIEISSDNIKYVAILVNVSYPNYAKVVPVTEGWNTLKVSLEDFQNALDIVTLKETAQKDVVLELDKDKIKLLKMDKGSIIASYTLIAEYTGASERVAINSDYIKQLCKVYDQKDLIVKIKDALHPFVFEYEGFKHIIMPLRINK